MKIIALEFYKNGFMKEALAASGELLLKNQLVTPDYVKAMYQRQQKVSVYIGNFVALPHAEGQDEQVLKEGICFIQVPDGVNFGTEADRKIATLLFVVALKSQRQLSMLQELAFFCSDLSTPSLSFLQLIMTKATDKQWLHFLNEKFLYLNHS